MPPKRKDVSQQSGKRQKQKLGTPQQEAQPHFIASIIAGVKDASFEGESDSESYTQTDKALIKKIAADKRPHPFKIKQNTKGEVHGYVPKTNPTVVESGNGSPLSDNGITQQLLQKLSTEALEESAIRLPKDVVSLSICLNRPLSLSERKNNWLKKEVKSRTESEISHKQFGLFWAVPWSDNNGNDVDYETVHSWYKKLKKYDHKHGTTLAQRFLEKNEEGLVLKVPYRDLREYARTHDATKALVCSAREEKHAAPIFLHIMDSDIRNFNGVYSAYLKHLKKVNKIPMVMSTGYAFEAERNGDWPIVQTALLDMKIRIATNKIIKGGVYLPEPNLCVLVPDGHNTIAQTFSSKKRGQGLESAVIIEQILSEYGSEGVVEFLETYNKIITSIPSRMREDIKIIFSEEFIQGGQPILQDIWNMHQVSQSSIGVFQWLKNLAVNNSINFGSAHANVRGAIQRFLQTGERDEDYLREISDENLKKIKEAYSLRQKVIGEYERQYAKAPDVDEFRRYMEKWNIDISSCSNKLIKVLSAAKVGDIISSRLLKITKVIEIDIEALQFILYDERIVNLIRSKENKFNEIYSLYLQYMGEIEESKSLYVLLTNQEIREFINSKTEQLLGLDLTNLDEVIELYQKHNQFKDLINILLTEKGKSFWNNHWSANNNLGELAEKYQKHPYACKAMIKAKPSILREHLDNYIDLYERYSKLITMYQLQDIGVYDTDTDDGKSHESEDRVPSSLGRHIALSSNEGLPSAEDLIEKFGNNRVMLYASSSETDESSEEESDEDDYEESSAESSEDNLEGDESEESDDRSSTNTVVSQKSHMSNLDDSDSKYEESEEVCSSDAQVDNNFASGYALDSDNETSIIGESTGS